MAGTRLSVEVRPVIPERLQRLEELANDLYFSWDRRIRRLFSHLDRACWEQCCHNPKVFLRRVSQNRLEKASKDPIFLQEYRRALSAYDTYLEERPQSDIDQHLDLNHDLIAYFSAEYGFHESVPIYSGGLGILAGDYCKAMSDLWLPFVGVGILYRQGYFTQRIRCCAGDQSALYPYTDAADLPVAPALDANQNEVRVHLELPGRHVELKIWEAKAGHIRLYLLDSDLPSNSAEDRAITYQLYGGDRDTRIQQEIVLGMGGLRALRALGLEPTVWHINEGHAAFLILERCREEIKRGLDFDAALELVAASTVFTTHTPVPAGHDVFDHDRMRTYFRYYMQAVRLDEGKFLALGATPRDPQSFSMTALALRGSRFHNGVSRIHGEVAAEMESYTWPQIPPEENPMGYVTNGVDISTFLGNSWATMFDMYMGPGWRDKTTDKEFWEKFIDSIPNHAYLSSHQILKAEMLEDAHRRILIQFRRGRCSESIIHKISARLTSHPHNLNTLVIGFARRFATYKRATLLFKDLERLARLLNDPERPVLFIFAGKPHPNDIPGQQLLREVAEISMRPEFLGKVILLEDYNLSMARKLLPGVDVWLNTPEYPKEACGTSGMKAAINGGLNLSVLDGWWGEAYDGENGWAIVPHTELDPQTRDHQEAMDLFNILEYQVIPLYYERRSTDGERGAWIHRSKASMKSILPVFNNIRMALDYVRSYYGPAQRRGKKLAENSHQGARDLAIWKKQVAAAWPGATIRLSQPIPKAVRSGESMPIEVAVRLNGLRPEDVVVECVLGRTTEFGEFIPRNSVHLGTTGQVLDGETYFQGNLCSDRYCALVEGIEHFKIRVYPYHQMMSHPFECGCMLWV